MPLGFTSTTRPLAPSWPKIWLGLWSRIRLKATAVAEGWLNCTLSFAPTLKVFQLSCTRLEDWLMTVAVADGVETVACPDTTTPPVGPARAEDIVPKPMTAANGNETGTGRRVVRPPVGFEPCMYEDSCERKATAGQRAVLETRPNTEEILRLATVAGLVTRHRCCQIQAREQTPRDAQLDRAADAAEVETRGLRGQT